MKISIGHWIFIGGIAHLLLALGSLSIPRLLSWKSNLTKIPMLFRQMFWVYAAYTLMTNVFFGIISVADASGLVNHSTLSTMLTGFIAAYWIARIFIQFFYFDKTETPKGFIYLSGEIMLNILFIFLSLVYGYAFIINIP